MPRINRDEHPDYAERARRMPDLIITPIMPLSDLALFLGVPLSTVDKLRWEGKGPQCFKIGKRLFVRRADLQTWFDKMAKEDPG